MLNGCRAICSPLPRRCRRGEEVKGESQAREQVLTRRRNWCQARYRRGARRIAD